VVLLVCIVSDCIVGILRQNQQTQDNVKAKARADAAEKTPGGPPVHTVHEVTLTASPDGVVSVPMAFVNQTDVGARGEGHMIFYLCNECTFAKEHPQMQKVDGRPEIMRDLPFREIPPRNVTSAGTMEVGVPKGSGGFQFGVRYRCSTSDVPHAAEKETVYRYVEMRGTDGQVHSTTLDAASLYDAAEKALAGWPKFWWYSSDAIIAVKHGAPMWTVSQQKLKDRGSRKH
jgi:hypothetical protein